MLCFLNQSLIGFLLACSISYWKRHAKISHYVATFVNFFLSFFLLCIVWSCIIRSIQVKFSSGLFYFSLPGKPKLWYYIYIWLGLHFYWTEPLQRNIKQENQIPNPGWLRTWLKKMTSKAQRVLAALFEKKKYHNSVFLFCCWRLDWKWKQDVCEKQKWGGEQHRREYKSRSWGERKD